MRIRSRRQRGSTLLPVTFVMVTVVGLSMGMMEHGLAEKTSLRHDETSATAFELAEVALTKAEMELRGNLDLDGNGIGVVEGTVPGGLGGDLQFEVVYARSPSDPTLVTLQAIGQANLSVRRVIADVKVNDGHRYAHAALATGKLKIEDDALTTSYDSRDAALPPDEQSLARLGPAAFQSGDVGAEGDLELKNDASVQGDARPGFGNRLILPGGDDVDDGRGVRVTGDTTPMPAARELPVPPQADFEAAVANHDNETIQWSADVSYRRSSLRLTAYGQAVVVFPAGTYYFNELKVLDGAKVIFEGPSKIYVTGKLELDTDAGFNLPGTPSDVEIIAHAYDVHDGFRRDKDPIEIKGNTRAALTLYAPGRDIDVEDRAAVYGAIVGDDVRVKNRAELHYDLALQDVDATAASVERLAWREQR